MPDKAMNQRQTGASNPAKRPTPSPDTEKSQGAGAAIAERSKDAKAPKAGRQSGAHVKR